MATVRMRVPRKTYDITEIETIVMEGREKNEGAERHPQFGSADPRRYQEMRDFYGAEEVRREMEQPYNGRRIHSFDANDATQEPSAVYIETPPRKETR